MSSHSWRRHCHRHRSRHSHRHRSRCRRQQLRRNQLQSERKFNYSCKQFENCTWRCNKKAQNATQNNRSSLSFLFPLLLLLLLVFSLVVVVCFAVYCLLFDVAVCRPLEPPHISQKTKAKGVNSARGRGWACRKKGMECRGEGNRGQRLRRLRRRREKQFSGWAYKWWTRPALKINDISQSLVTFMRCEKQTLPYTYTTRTHNPPLSVRVCVCVLGL